MKIDCENPGLEEMFLSVDYPISPEQAVVIALREDLIQCNSKFVVYLYFANGYYYFSKLWQLQDGKPLPDTIVIDASNGDVVPVQ